MSLQDANGKEVAVGDLVKVLSLDAKDFGHLDEKALSEVLSMVGETLEVYEIDDYGQAWVMKEFHDPEVDYMEHSVGLSSAEMELQSAHS